MKAKVSKVYNLSEPPLAAFTPREGIDPTTLLFQEWSDQEIRTENWSASGKGVPKPESSLRIRSRSSAQANDADVTDTRFEDDQVINLPYSIIAYEWKTASEVFPDVNLQVYVDSNEYPDLISGNKHLLHSEFMRSLISSVYILTYLGNTTQFAIESVSSNFMPTTGNSPWRPWHHIYSNDSAGSRKEHAPTINKVGKYVVRLFWMGTWRKIYVDDRVPVDMLNHVLLPSVTTVTKEKVSSATKGSIRLSTSTLINSEEKSVQLWPFLLSKALLKIASLSWYKDREVIDFDIIQCLTGWLPQKINTKGMSPLDIWQICYSNTNQFTYPVEIINKSAKSKSSQRGSKVEIEEDKKYNILEETSYPCYVVGRCNDLRDFDDWDELSIFPCWTHEFLIHQTRDIPLVKPTITADLQSWKRLRWLDWAADKGMIGDEELLPEIKNYRLVSPFKKISEHIIYKQPSKISFHEPCIPEVAELATKEKNGEGKRKGKVKESGKDQKSSKASKKSPQPETKRNSNILNSNSIISDPSFWIDHNKLSHQINTLTVYYKPSEFKAKVEVTNLDQKREKKEGKSDWQVVVISPDLQKCRNEPIYIFTESIDNKTIVTNFSQVGFTDTCYPRKGIEKTPTVTDKFTECDFCLAALVKRVKGNITKEEFKDYISVAKPESSLVIHQRPLAHFVIEEYNWTSDQLGHTITSVNTYGSKVTTLAFGPGRKILKLWIKSDDAYVAHIFSDTPLVVGGIESILFCMSEESQLLEATCIDIANSFGSLVEAFCTPTFLAKLRTFYSSYKPIENLTKTESIVVHNTFLDQLFEAVQYGLNKKGLYALKVLLLRWQFPLRLNYPEEHHMCNCYEEEDFEFLKATERYVVKLQAFFRGIYERSLMKHHQLSHPDNATINESLLIIYANLFSRENRFVKCPTLIRRLMEHPAMKNIREKYNFYQDLNNVLTLKQFSNAVKVGENQWSFICRQQFFVTSTDPVPMKINLFCSVDQYVVRVIDNDNGTEIKRYTNNVSAYPYKSNLNGYTVLCYVWSASHQNLRYKLNFAMKKELEGDKVLWPTFSTQTHSYHGMYIPNINNNICKYLINVRSECALISIHCNSSYQDVIINLKLFDDKDRILKNIIGKGNVILPAIFLTNRNNYTFGKNANEMRYETSASSFKKKRSKMTLKSQKLDSRSRLSLQGKKPRLKSTDRSSNSNESPRPKSGSQSARSYIPPYYKRSDSKNKEKVFLDKPTAYRLEINVLDDSWPLNSEEWRNVDSGFSVESQISQTDFRNSIWEGQSTMSVVKSPKPRSSVFRQSRICKRVLHKPYWMLEIIRNKCDYLEVVKDTRRETDLMEVKLKWWEADFTRASDGQNIRAQFLEEYQIPNPDQLKHFGSNTRSLVKTAFAAKALPSIDLSYYMNKDPKEAEARRKIKTRQERDLDNDRDKALHQEAENRHTELVEKMEKITEKQKESINIINEWFGEVRHESHQMMANAMQLRSKCMHALLEDQKKNKEKKNGVEKVDKKEKKSKKDKNAKKSKKDKKG